MLACACLLSLLLPTAVHRPAVAVWTNRGEDPGVAVRVFFRTTEDAYVTLLRVDTDGRVRVLFPREPWDERFVRGGREYEVSRVAPHVAFEVNDRPGVGYVFAVASRAPFAYDAIASAEQWDYHALADDGRIQGDPYVALTDLARRILPGDSGTWDYDVVPYYVGEHYPYPRFLCSECHASVSYPYWDPYARSCPRFRLVISDDPSYYPRRRFGAQVMLARPYRPEPRFVFEDRVPRTDYRAGVRMVPPPSPPARPGVRTTEGPGRAAHSGGRSEDRAGRPSALNRPPPSTHTDRPERPRAVRSPANSDRTRGAPHASSSGRDSGQRSRRP